MALMGGSVNNNSGGMLANLLGGVNASNGGSAIQLGFGGDFGSQANFSGGQQPGMPFTEFNVPSRPGYQMVNLSSIHHPLPDKPAEKHVSRR